MVHQYCRNRLVDVSETYSYSAHGTETYSIQKAENAFPRVRIILFGLRSLSFGSKLNLVFLIDQSLWCRVDVDIYESYGTAIMTKCKTYTLVYLSKTFLCVCRQICDICHIRYWRWSQRQSSELTVFIVRKILIKSGPKREDARGDWRELYCVHAIFRTILHIYFYWT
jgi:hypothetical protein